ncbi:MAG: mannitol dehydrogenase family protein, partial [Pseudomonadota bacterium]
LGRDRDWAILGAGVMPGDARMRSALEGQDWLTTVVEQSAEASAARVTGAMVAMAPVGDAPAILSALADPRIRIVSLTVTEGGYFLDAAGRFDPSHPAIVAERARPDAPATVFGLIAAGLKARRAAGVPAFTVMSCDNIPHNGAAALGAVAGAARIADPALADWIEAEVAFPNGMVDRITPATGERERRALTDAFGVDDAWPVFCEDFSQWVLEDRFPTGRPRLEDVGVQFASDVTPYETMKIRILNGGHAAIAYPAGLMGIDLVHDAMGDPLIRGFLRKLLREEVIPILPQVPGVDVVAYAGEIERRFANPKIADQVARLCHDGAARQPKFIVPSIADRLAAGAPVDGLALASALWCRYCFGETEAGETIEPNAPDWTDLAARSRAARGDPAAWLSLRRVYGDIAAAAPFRTAFAAALKALWTDGVETTLRRYLDRPGGG